jgi:hypothetical protein
VDVQHLSIAQLKQKFWAWPELTLWKGWKATLCLGDALGKNIMVLCQAWLVQLKWLIG